MLTHQEIEAFDRDGFVIRENLFSEREVAIMLAAAVERDGGTGGFALEDKEGRASRLNLWGEIGDDAFSCVSANQRVVNSVRAILRDDVYHWHSKVMFKEPQVGGAWEWHQDYGYWYRDKVLFPRMVSVMIALDPATRENGCLKVIPGSHHLGRLDHGMVGKQQGVEADRVAEIELRLGVCYCEAGPGSAIFFHANTLHSSEANLSDRPRRAFICCYNALSNPPFGGGGHGKPVPIALKADDALLSFDAARTAHPSRP